MQSLVRKNYIHIHSSLPTLWKKGTTHTLPAVIPQFANSLTIQEPWKKNFTMSSVTTSDLK